MAYVPTYTPEAPDRAEIDIRPGRLLLEFGANWCGHCLAAQPAIEAAMRDFPELEMLKIEDGPGRRLGRSFRVKLWPTLILMQDGREIGRLVRPGDAIALHDLLALRSAPGENA